ncbi:MAG TPA: hypothetical protein VHG72_22855 [Polyangia bacterium]|nr:hypothetical protein [Polyangia bacterium]
MTARFYGRRTTKELKVLRVSFSSVTTARAAGDVLEAYGCSARQVGRDVITDCPTLLALSVLQSRVGFAEVQHLDLNAGARAIESTAVFSGPRVTRAERGIGLTA